MPATQRILLALALAVLPTLALGAQGNPPRRLDFSGDSAATAARDTTPRSRGETSPRMRTAFVRDQTFLGLGIYAPSFTALMAKDGITGTATYLVIAGGSFFAASELARRLEITPGRNYLTTGMALRSATDGFMLGHATDLEGRQIGGVTFLFAIGGTASGLAIGRDLTSGEAVATIVGHDLTYLSTFALTHIIKPEEGGGLDVWNAQRLVAPAILGWGGYYLGHRYAVNAPYTVTAGDAPLLWLGGAIGAAGLGAFIANGDPPTRTVAGTLLVGGLAGIYGADRLLVRRYDHSPSEGMLVSLGGFAGALMGIGVGVLVTGEAERDAGLTIGFAALGATAGALLSERYATPAPDGGGVHDDVGALGRVQFNPLGVVGAAARVEGVHPILRFTF